MGLADVSPVPRYRPAADSAITEREGLVRRVASSNALERSPRLRAFFLHVCQCALDNAPECATEQQIGIRVYERPPGYNPNEDNIVRSQARLLRMKLEHYFANEGKDEPVVITIPKGRYLPVFETRSEQVVELSVAATTTHEQGNSRRLLQLLIGTSVLFGLLTISLVYLLLRARSEAPQPSTATGSQRSELGDLHPIGQSPASQRVAMLPVTGEVRIAAGRTSAQYVDVWGRRWDTDRFYEGGVPQPGPKHFFPPVADDGLFRSRREAIRGDLMLPREFRYSIPVPDGVYELKLYFADPSRRPDADDKEDAQNSRIFQVNLNGHPLLVNFDPIADAGSAAVDVRAFKDIRPAEDGKVHLEFISGWADPAFVTALELTPGKPGKMSPVRLAVRQSDYVDPGGTRWSGDNYFIGGRTHVYGNPETGPKIPELYTGERHGNFTYAIPVAPGSYTVRLHFLESFFSPLIANARCGGVGCRVFDVTCNGVELLHDFDIVNAAGGAFRSVTREFHGLHPNGQGKLLLSFSPRVNYAEVRAIEVLDEAK
jgi:hypothetical protein